VRKLPLFPLLAATALLPACSGEPEAEKARAVLAIQIGVGGESAGQVFNGVIAAPSEAPLSFRVPGQITALLVQRGQIVRRGQPLMRLDGADYRLSASQARAQATAAANEAEAAARIAERAVADERREAGLVATGSVSPQAYDATKAAADAAKANLKAAQERASAAQAAAKLASNQNGYATLVAEADGVVTDVFAEPGQVIGAGQPVIGLARQGAREIVITVPEAARNSLPRSGKVTIPATGQTFAARLKDVTGAADPVTRSFSARYVLTGAEKLAPGLTATLSLESTGGKQQIVLVPLGSVLDRGKGAMVWVIGSDQKVQLRRVQLGAIRDEKIEIVSGLKQGERVVAAGAHALNEGQKVRIGRLPQ